MKHVDKPGKPRGGPHFEPGDLALLEEGLHLVPDLLMALVFAKLARKKLTYPISSHEELLTLFDGDGNFAFENRVIDFEEVRMFFPKIFFPIESEQEFISKVYLSLCIGKESHSRTRKLINFQALIDDLKLPPDVAKNLPIPQ